MSDEIQQFGIHGARGNILPQASSRTTDEILAQLVYGDDAKKPHKLTFDLERIGLRVRALRDVLAKRDRDKYDIVAADVAIGNASDHIRQARYALERAARHLDLAERGKP